MRVPMANACDCETMALEKRDTSVSFSDTRAR